MILSTDLENVSLEALSLLCRRLALVQIEVSFICQPAGRAI